MENRRWKHQEGGGGPRRAEPVARDSSGQGWVQEELDLISPASFPFRAKAREEKALGSRQWGTAPGAAAPRTQVAASPALRGAGLLPRPPAPARPRGREEGKRSLHTYPRRGAVPAPARCLRPSSRRDVEPPRAGARHAGEGREGEVGWEEEPRRSAAAATGRPSGSRAPRAPGGEGKAFGNGDGPDWRGSGTTAAAARGHNPGGGRQRGEGRGGARTPPLGP